MFITNREKIKLVWIGTVKLMSEIALLFKIGDMFYVPCIRRILISFSRLDKLGIFGNGFFQKTFQSHIVGNGVMNAGCIGLK